MTKRNPGSSLPAPGRAPAINWLRALAPSGMAVFLALLLGLPWGPVPPPGRLFSPVDGFWRNAEDLRHRDEILSLPGLRDTVHVVIDGRGVPHVFARNDEDLYCAQGFITARDRLWQMEFQAHAAAGRLAEIFGEPALEHDLSRRRQAIPQAARVALELLERDPVTRAVIRAYTRGVNAYISSLDRGDEPLEYKLFRYSPEPWTPFKTVLLIKNLQWTLTGGDREIRITNTMVKFGPGFMEKFFPVHGHAWSPLAAELKPVKGALRAETPTRGFRPGLVGPVAGAWPEPGNGSNGLAVSGGRTKEGRSLLANDPHLDLTLPSLWYEMQLVSPTVNVYGVTLPGTPSVLIGFNRHIAWGLTNGESDVLDWYRVDFRDSTLAQYRHGGRWIPASFQPETLMVRGGGEVIDSVLFTHHGPVVQRRHYGPYSAPAPRHVMRWLGHDPSDELRAFLRINRARDQLEFARALETFNCPAQNFVVADARGGVGALHAGLLPLRWRGQGRYIGDGGDTLYEWQGWIPRAHLPAAVNPRAGFVVAANQAPADSAYPYYLGRDFANGERAARIDGMISGRHDLTMRDLQGVLLDEFSLHAKELLPALLGRLDTAGMDLRERRAYSELAAWDYRYIAEGIAPTIFDAWWRRLFGDIWADEYGRDTLRYKLPPRDRTRRLILEEPDAPWFDNLFTPEKESLATLARKSFRDACRELQERLGRQGPAWRWGLYREVEVRHLARLPGLGSGKLEAPGCGECVNRLRSHHGPSWRMVVSPGPVPEAYGIYPGGQSGNPGSPLYDNFLEAWRGGSLHKLIFLAFPGDLEALGKGGIRQRLMLEGS